MSPLDALRALALPHASAHARDVMARACAEAIVRGRKRVAYGAVVGVARLAGVEDEAPEDEAYWCGPWGWRLDEVRAIEPVPCKGAQGLWTLPPEVLATVRERWAAAKEVPHG